MRTARFPENTLVMLTTAPAGLGHIRVMEALRGGLSKETSVVDLGVRDVPTQTVHRITSINPALRAFMETVQNNPILEGGFSKIYRDILQLSPQTIFDEIITKVEQQPHRIERLVIMCTHFGIAYQVTGIRQAIESHLKLKLVIGMVVTDDSPQLIWAVSGIDYMFVPSQSTRAGMEAHLATVGGQTPQLVVVPYPVSPSLSQPLSDQHFAERKDQLKGKANTPLTVMIPISGAAVQLSYFQELIQNLSQRLPALIIVVARQSANTAAFLAWCRKQNGVTVLASSHDRDVVKHYEQAYKREVVGVEITKPSEQTFKALLTPKQRGGSVLLFSDAVGRQEDDNLLFLSRHNLMPDLKQRKLLAEGIDGGLKSEAKKWRGLILPDDGADAARYIHALLQTGILEAMGNFSGFMPGHSELGDDGVEQVWKRML